MPSPRKPSTWLRALSVRIMRFFWAGETRAKTVGVLDHVGERRVAHTVQIFTEYDVFGVNADLGADVARNQFIVAGHNLEASAVAPHRSDRLGGAFE